MSDSWEGIVVGVLGLTVAALLVASHYRRELIRRRMLRQMDPRQCWDVMRDRR
ncbi:hypothetical protein R75461_05878 [Paraburkholderia nemoris]|uniref:hypothetical protein n=1 Tax=Paraburkholderia nemoris TaxID=2793076 RepID=UPI0019092836|nr:MULTISPECIES: hypothetical protein [Paraburkholderia]CAE6816117.1 hypothetical protein R75461_05878 [Paraburkholderia nemoris]